MAIGKVPVTGVCFRTLISQFFEIKSQKDTCVPDHVDSPGKLPIPPPSDSSHINKLGKQAGC
jgi:hypothetical protein